MRGYRTILRRRRRSSALRPVGLDPINPLCATGAVLAGPTPRALERYDVAVMEDLATPDTAWFPPLYRADQAHLPHGTITAQRLRELEVRWGISEPEIGIVHLTRQFDRRMPADRRGRHAEPRSCASRPARAGCRRWPEPEIFIQRSWDASGLRERLEQCGLRIRHNRYVRCPPGVGDSSHSQISAASVRAGAPRPRSASITFPQQRPHFGTPPWLGKRPHIVHLRYLW